MNMPGVAGVGSTMQAEKAAAAAAASPNDENVEMEDAEHEVDDLAANKPKKKRRVIKTSDKKYECPQPDCGKSYSRAEHLYRHQLNHTPKQIYHCDFPGCDRHFVRADLCARHKERHTAKGSHLQRKDAFMNSQRVATNNTNHASGANPNSGSGTTTAMSLSPVDSQHHVAHPPSQQETYAPPPTAQPVQPYSAPSVQPEQYSNQSGINGLPPMQTGALSGAVDAQMSQASSYPSYATNYNGQAAAMPPPQAGARRYSIDEQYGRPSPMANGGLQHPPLTVGQMHPPPLSSSSTATMYSSYQPPTPAQSEYRSPPTSSYPTLPALQPYGVQPGYAPPGSGNARAGSTMSPPTMGTMDPFQVSNSRTNNMMDFNVLEQIGAGYAMPVFGGDGFHRSPQSALDDALFNQLLASGDIDLSGAPSPPPETTYESHMPSIPMPKLEPETWMPEPTGKDTQSNTAPPVIAMDLSMRESVVTERRQARLLEVVRNFEDVGSLPCRKSKEEILAGDISDPNHPMSVNMWKTYLTSFWIHIHQQMPIMHRPTFNAETCPDLLLLAMACLGACCLERTHSPELIKHCAELAFFCAYHIRWEVFKDAEFRPTAKLWTFQTMLLLELFEKMYSTRPLHERAHIHHATTLTVMRRGSSLIGRSTFDSPDGVNDPTRTPPGPEGTINTSGQNTPDAWWNRWITAEATRRVAFAAFIIDSTHATLFGHAAVMSPHDIRLPLPCDEALWSATSSAEVQRVEASLAANGFKPVSFLEGLKKMLNGQKVRTNIFGRVILMAGLLNVSWHMNQRDLQVSSIGASNTLGNPTRWRSPITRAFDFWRRDFDESLTKSDSWPQVANPENQSRCHSDHRDNVFESRTCLHSLAHMAMHADIVDCEVFAGSDRALGRVVTEADRAAVQTRMREQWAPSARARDATFYALRFLCEVLIPDGDLRGEKARGSPSFTYSARDDYLLNRPWIVYFAMLIVWSYGYALDGAINPPHFKVKSRELQVYDMQNYLIRMGGVATPEELEGLHDRNECVGMLILLRDIFRQPRWELLHEAADMFQLCIELLLPGDQEVKAAGGAS
ncbi:related to C2H2 finger domain [Lecanosticta acicola]|uniref:Related to C2H2 finger domain n=1 Tax=Lecanosticta acicola TaxID=111012 RepID=A0AAI9ECC4_9PEZI|nr:related to C2H2 finger domain [Lecanosticta acicola]